MNLEELRAAENPIVWDDLFSILNSFPSWDFFKGQNILITGGNGFLASYLLRSLLLADLVYSLDLHVTCLVRSLQSDLFRVSPWLFTKSLSLIYGEAQTFPYSTLHPQSIVIHAASGASPSLYKLHPVDIILPNSVGTARLCEQAVQWSSQRFLLFSSGEVYGHNSNLPLSEHNIGLLDHCALRSCYAESKRCAESTCIAYTQQHSLHTVIARIFHTYGPQINLNDGRVFADFIRDAVHGTQIRVASNGKSKRCFCYIQDLTSGLLQLIAHGSSGEAYNISNPNAEISISNLALLVAEKNVPPLEVLWLNSYDTKPDYLQSPIHRSLPSIAKIQSLGWQPVVGLHEGLDRTLHSYL